MQEYRIGGKVAEKQQKVFLNQKDDYIMLNPNNSVFVDKYTAIIQWLEEKSAFYQKEMAALEKKNKGHKLITVNEDESITLDTKRILEITGMRTAMCRECCAQIDELFGAGTVSKYFREIYEEIPDFIPDEECIYDFFDEIGPIVGAVFNARVQGLKTKYNRNRKGRHNKSKEDLIEELKERNETDDE